MVPSPIEYVDCIKSSRDYLLPGDVEIVLVHLLLAPAEVLDPPPLDRVAVRLPRLRLVPGRHRRQRGRAHEDVGVEDEGGEGRGDDEDGGREAVEEDVEVPLGRDDGHGAGAAAAVAHGHLEHGKIIV